MAAQTEARECQTRNGRAISLPVKAATIIYAGALVAINADGNALPAADTAGLTVVGVATESVDNSAGAAGDLDIEVKTGMVVAMNGTLTAEDIGRTAWVRDDNTVGALSETTNAVRAGQVFDADGTTVWVMVEPVERQAPQLFSVRVAGTNAAAISLDAAAAQLGGTSLLVRRVVSMFATVAATGAATTPIERRLTTDYTVASGVITLTANETANNLHIIFYGELT